MANITDTLTPFAFSPNEALSFQSLQAPAISLLTFTLNYTPERIAHAASLGPPPDGMENKHVYSHPKNSNAEPDLSADIDRRLL